MEQATGPLTTRQIFEITRHEVPDVGISTVYRALKMLQSQKGTSAIKLKCLFDLL